MEAAGGGAFLDYCCYGACMASWFLGERPTAAYGLKANFASQYGDAEDYGAIMARYPEAVAILEGSWTTRSQWHPLRPDRIRAGGHIGFRLGEPSGNL